MTLTASIGQMHEAMDYHLARHNLLTANMAHVDTPGYRSRELFRVQPFEQVLGRQLAMTDSRHLGGSNRPAGWQIGVDRFAPVGPDGNAVSIDREAVKIAANNLRYDAVSTMLQGELSRLQYAAQDGR